VELAHEEPVKISHNCTSPVSPMCLRASGSPVLTVAGRNYNDFPAFMLGLLTSSRAAEVLSGQTSYCTRGLMIDIQTVFFHPPFR